jgi:hypothetical protein
MKSKREEERSEKVKFFILFVFESKENHVRLVIII